MNEFDIKIEAILEQELYTTPPLMNVVVAKFIGTKHDIPRAFNLTKNISVNELKHLRRIKDVDSSDMECIICRAPDDENNGEQNSDTLLKDLSDKYESENLFKDYRIVKVPSKAPKTNHQWEACSKIWPCKFAKSNYLIQCIEGAVFEPVEQLVIKVIVNNVLSYIKSYPTMHSSAAVVFRYAKIYGVGLSSLDVLKENPTKHSTMLAIDSVARGVGGGHWPDIDRPDGLLLKSSIQEKLDEYEDFKDYKIDDQFLPYLCTNYDIFVTEEPCVMCTMGLVQSRIRRLFYLDSKSVEGSTDCQVICYPDRAIEKFLIHRDKNLNHRFEAWRINLTPVK